MSLRGALALLALCLACVALACSAFFRRFATTISTVTCAASAFQQS